MSAPGPEPYEPTDEAARMDDEHPELWETVWTAIYENSNTLSTPVMDRLAVGVCSALLAKGVEVGS